MYIIAPWIAYSELRYIYVGGWLFLSFKVLIAFMYQMLACLEILTISYIYIGWIKTLFVVIRYP